jgi:hypothetical protein
VIVDGRIVVDRKTVVRVDEQRILATLRSMEREMLSRTGISISSPWKFV